MVIYRLYNNDNNAIYLAIILMECSGSNENNSHCGCILVAVLGGSE